MREDPDIEGRINDLVMDFKKNITTEEWENLSVIILGSHMARHGNIFSQYFGKVLDTRITSGKRIIFAESLNMKQSINLLSTHLIDLGAGAAFWNK